MYTTDYFVRFVIDQNQATRDRRRGYSFSSYAFFNTKAEAVEYWQEMGVADPEIGRCKHGFGLKLNGLCGFGPFETAQEAAEFATRKGGYNGVQYPLAMICTGRYSEQADCGDGDTFHVDHLVKTLELQ